MSPIDRLFLDANVLFSAAYRTDAGVRRLWELSDAVLVTSYAAPEVRRTLDCLDQREELAKLLLGASVSDAVADLEEHPELEEANLPEKDSPILRAAVAAGATHLITGDRRHFGHLYGSMVAGVLVLRPADYLQKGE